MHVAFVSPFDARAIRSWSGIPYFMSRAMGAHVERVSYVTPLRRRGSLGAAAQTAARKLRHRLRGEPYYPIHTEAVARVMAEEAAEGLARLRPDAVLAPSSLPVAYLDAGCPTAFWTDATFESMLHFYEGYGALPEDNLLEGHRVEGAALARSRFALYASDYAARSARHYYGAAPERVHVVPFGANLDRVPDAAVSAAIDARPTDACRLLFLGVDWVRKGGDVAVLVADAMNRAGLPTTLDVVGLTPRLDRPRPYVHAHGFISKETPEGRARLERLILEAHALVMPVRAEAFGCVFCEASAFGLPSVTTTAGGAGSAVTDGVNGLLYPPRPDPEAIAERLLALVRDRDAYRALARGARAEYERRLNWHAATGRVAALLAAAA